MAGAAGLRAMPMVVKTSPPGETATRPIPGASCGRGRPDDEDGEVKKSAGIMTFGVILAGGRSQRMGSDKADLQLDGKPVLERTRDLMRAAGVDRVLVSGRPQLTDGFADLNPHSGPPGAVLSTLDWLRQHYGLDGSLLLFLPVDMPLLQRDTLLQLLDTGQAVSACHFEQQVFPCTMKATERLYRYLLEALPPDRQPGTRCSMKAILRWQEALGLPVAPAREPEFTNTNTPEDWANVLQLWQRCGRSR